MSAIPPVLFPRLPRRWVFFTWPRICAASLKARSRLLNQRLHNVDDAEVARQIAAFEPDIVGLSSLTPSAHHLPWLTQTLAWQLPNALIVLGGPHVSTFGAETLKMTAAHVAVPGEGELALCAIIEAFCNGENFSTIPGIFWKDKNNEVIENPGFMPLISDLDSLPMPAYDLIDIRQYWKRQSFAEVPRRRYISLFSSRGCPYGCIYCHRIFGRSYRPHSAERIVDEIKFFQKQYGIADFEFLDDIFNLDRKRIFAFSELIAKENIKIKIMFPNGVRTDILEPDEINALVQSGLCLSAFALESGSPRIQKYIGKNLNIERFLRNVELATRRGVFGHGFAMVGFPTETEKEMQETIAVACQSRLHTLSCFIVTPFPNTDLFHIAQKTHAEQLKQINYSDMGSGQSGAPVLMISAINLLRMVPNFRSK